MEPIETLTCAPCTQKSSAPRGSAVISMTKICCTEKVVKRNTTKSNVTVMRALALSQSLCSLRMQITSKICQTERENGEKKQKKTQFSPKSTTQCFFHFLFAGGGAKPKLPCLANSFLLSFSWKSWPCGSWDNYDVAGIL